MMGGGGRFCESICAESETWQGSIEFLRNMQKVRLNKLREKTNVV